MRFKNKYRATRVGNFASKLEKAVYDILKAQEVAGEISCLQCQGEVRLTDANILYKPDFVFFKNKAAHYAEAKGFKTAVWAIKKRLWEHYGPGPLDIYEGNWRYPVLKETVIPK